MRIFSFGGRMHRKGRKYTPDEILPRVEYKLADRPLLIEPDPRKTLIRERDIRCLRDLDGDAINFCSSRLRLFALKGISCVTCGIVGEFFIKQKHSGANQYHLGFYAVDGHGNEIEMTKDHIIPKSKGGHNHMDNYQVMCYICNQAKGNNPDL